MVSVRMRLICLLLVALLIHILSYFPPLVERYYTQGVYPYIAGFFRFLFGCLPFSLGDLLYAAGILLLLIASVRLCLRLIRGPDRFGMLTALLRRSLRVGLLLYIFFKVSWGLNYNRSGIRSDLNLHVPENYSTGSLQALARDMLDRTNTYRRALGDRLPQAHPDSIFAQAVHAYAAAEKTFPFLAYHQPSIKIPLWNELGNYLGYGGYFNPFTHEAQVHTHVPVFLLPFTTCHEIAHQLGYASEDEANFAGFLTASHSDDPLFRYSVSFAMYRYANRELWFRDSTLAKANYSLLDTLVKQDYQEMIRFYESYQNPLDNLTSYLYHQYLIANDQPQGLETYNQVTALLLAYRKSLKNR